MKIVYEIGRYRVESFLNGKYGIWNKPARMYVSPLNCPLYFSDMQGAINAANSLNSVDMMREWVR